MFLIYIYVNNILKLNEQAFCDYFCNLKIKDNIIKQRTYW